jgi:hypothetical protein
MNTRGISGVIHAANTNLFDTVRVDAGFNILLE